MIIINLRGGLGNQMFQYAFGRKLSLKNNDVLKLDIDGLKRANEIGDIYRPFSLGRFAIHKNIATSEEVLRLKYPYGIFSKLWRWVKLHILKQANILWHPPALNKKGDIFLDGYWQSPKYFNDIREILLKEFYLSDSLGDYGENIAQQIQNTDSVSVHVRRGDYTKNTRVIKDFGMCSEKYYQQASDHIKNNIQDPTYFIFSDDIKWVKENLPIADKSVFVSDLSLTDSSELFLMSQCKHNIIANSSFSWWAAWINNNQEKIVIAPTPWFENAIYDPSLYIDSWIQIPKN